MELNQYPMTPIFDVLFNIEKKIIYSKRHQIQTQPIMILINIEKL